MTERQHAESVASFRSGRRQRISDALVSVLGQLIGEDNVSAFEDDPLKIGIAYSDGDFVTIRIDGSGAGSE